MPLTDSVIRALRPAEKTFRESDGGGLMLEVTPSGAKRFRLKYRISGRQKMIGLGDYPDVSLRAARSLREAAKAALAEGRDPQIEVRPGPLKPRAYVGVSEGSFASYMRDYLAKREKDGAAEPTLAKMRVYAREVEKVIGSHRMVDVRAPDIIEACRIYDERGMYASAHQVRTLCSQVFRYAIARGVETFDYASVVRDALPKATVRNFAALTSPAEVGKLMRAIRIGPIRFPQIRAGLLLSAYTAQRSSQIRNMRWDQIDEEVWHCPAEQMKGPRGTRRDHLVPLSRQAVEVIESLRGLTGREELVLFSSDSKSGLISENSMNKALDRLGFGSEVHRQHGFRTTFSTTMNELGWNADWIEMQLAHVTRERVRGVYNKARYLPQRAEMMQAYADWLDDQEAQSQGTFS
ncbi:MAG: integrase arm-type DNA-binding domain-containing protein [Pseudomonadota bacterium]